MKVSSFSLSSGPFDYRVYLLLLSWLALPANVIIISLTVVKNFTTMKENVSESTKVPDSFRRASKMSVEKVPAIFPRCPSLLDLSRFIPKFTLLLSSFSLGDRPPSSSSSFSFLDILLLLLVVSAAVARCSHTRLGCGGRRSASFLLLPRASILLFFLPCSQCGSAAKGVFLLLLHFFFPTARSGHGSPRSSLCLDLLPGPVPCSQSREGKGGSREGVHSVRPKRKEQVENLARQKMI